MNMLITAWLLVAGIYCLCTAGLRIAAILPRVAVFLVTLPAQPFLVAWRNRKEAPFQARAICWLWGVLYAVAILFGILG